MITYRFSSYTIWPFSAYKIKHTKFLDEFKTSRIKYLLTFPMVMILNLLQQLLFIYPSVVYKCSKSYTHVTDKGRHITL